MTRTITTDADLRDEVTLYLQAGDDAADFDVDGIVTEIVHTYGLVSIDSIDSEQWVSILDRHCSA